MRKMPKGGWYENVKGWYQIPITMPYYNVCIFGFWSVPVQDLTLRITRFYSVIWMHTWDDSTLFIPSRKSYFLKSVKVHQSKGVWAILYISKPLRRSPCTQHQHFLRLTFQSHHLLLHLEPIIEWIFINYNTLFKSQSNINPQLILASMTFMDMALMDALRYWSPWTMVSGVGGRLLLYEGYRLCRKFWPSKKVQIKLGHVTLRSCKTMN